TASGPRIADSLQIGRIEAAGPDMALVMRLTLIAHKPREKWHEATDDSPGAYRAADRRRRPPARVRSGRRAAATGAVARAARNELADRNGSSAAAAGHGSSTPRIPGLNLAAKRPLETRWAPASAGARPCSIQSP